MPEWCSHCPKFAQKRQEHLHYFDQPSRITAKSDEVQRAPHEDRSSRAAPRHGHEPIHCAISKAGLSVSLFFKERGDGGLQSGDNVVVPCFLAGPYGYKGCVQKVQSGEKNLQCWMWRRRGMKR